MTEEKQHLDEDGKRKRTSCFPINLDRGLQRRIRMAASQKDRSVDEYAERLLEQAVPGEKSLRLEWVQRLRKLREEILQDRGGHPFEDSTALIRQMREERSRELEELSAASRG